MMSFIHYILEDFVWFKEKFTIFKLLDKKSFGVSFFFPFNWPELNLLFLKVRFKKKKKDWFGMWVWMWDNIWLSNSLIPTVIIIAGITITFSDLAIKGSLHSFVNKPRFIVCLEAVYCFTHCQLLLIKASVCKCSYFPEILIN